MDAIINLCQDGDKGMSACTKAGEGAEEQEICSFYEKSQAGSRCMYEIFGDFCDRVAAQKHAKGQPILLTDIKGEEILDHPNLWRETIDNPNTWKADPETYNRFAMVYEDGSMRDAQPSEVVRYVDNSGVFSHEIMREMMKEIKKVLNAGEIKEIIISDDSVEKLSEEDLEFLKVHERLHRLNRHLIEKKSHGIGHWPLHSQQGPYESEDEHYVPMDKRFPKKDVCENCAVGYSFCKNRCLNYIGV
jgi:hypothetical protein